MSDINPDRLIWIVTGVQLKAELGDRPLAYRIERELRDRLATMLGPPEAGGPPRLAPVVVSDVYYLNSEDAQKGPTISIGGPGMNALSASLVEQLPTPVAIENTLVVQMDLDMNDLRCAVWGMNHLDTVRAVDTFIAKGYLDTFVKGVVEQLDQE
ncbi:MAG TPA: hypothetical protein VGR35_18120 [Tepidisphaeraceae bacterium]|nr:hypothetical protein [Tepidisphaeraceae bacterium]